MFVPQPSMNREVHSQVKSVMFKSNHPNQCKKSIYNLCKVIKDAKREFQIKLS